MGGSPDWSRLAAPSLADFERLAEVAYAELPRNFRDLCEGLVIRIEDFAEDEVLDDLGAESEFDVLGLFRGRGLAQGEAFGVSGQFPNMVWLYRRPILDYWAEHDETLGAIVTHVLVHEIGHHFGLSDEDMMRIERGASSPDA
ncbi:MAG TPA: metallopeptidase family protein [Beijerinckiaceae bacterium]|jgi:predicted Zn-dependent protease with MMP-like domain|nr:metallopeptidase family protein [Beijerinckiaceae bacterium]